jgi:6-phosphogluconolactonase
MHMIARSILGATLLVAATGAFAADHVAYVGTYTAGASKGIYGLRFGTGGKLESLGVLAEVANPSFLATDKQHRFLYALSEKNAPKDPSGFLSSYAIDPATGALRFLNRVSANGTVTGHLAVDGSGRWLLAANYGSGSVAVFALGADGSIGAMSDFKQHAGSSVDVKRQMGPHPHEVVMSSDNRFLFVPDLGLDRIFSYRFDAATGKLAPNDPASTAVPPGFGPRHMIFGRGEAFAYVLGEMGSKVIALSHDKTRGALTPIQTIATIPAGFTGENNSAELALDRDGRFLYASNRGHDSVTQFAIDPKDGTLTLVAVTPSGGKIPRNIAITPSGDALLAANQDSNSIVVFRRERGKLNPTGETVDIPSPVCILFVPLRGSAR